ncbi:NAD synthetase, partial [candidate division MSBL1 archaeon SCGC-AAA261F19]
MATLKDIERSLEIRSMEIERKLTKFIRDKIEDANAEGVVLGLSGGVDSSTATFLCAKALGGRKVLALSLPEKGTTNLQERKNAKKVAKKLDIDFRIIEISPILEEFRERIEDFDEESKLPAANLRPRVRMTIIYYYANLQNRLVVGGSNRSELRAGYFTKYGDGASDLAPLGCLYKSQVLELARHLKVPESIIL